ncbi:MAG TPA: ABC transporter ATP-binding protein [Bacteroidetes bacterium]|nr:ABC transporter ATP-binding protein [Bacteroidota bacterium]
MIEIKKITKSFHGRGAVFTDFSLTVDANSMLAVTGPSGSGKTTLINIIGSLDKPDKGEVLFNRRSILTFTADESASYRNRNIGFVFQEHLLMPHLTIIENIMLPLFANKITDEVYAEKVKYADRLMKRVGIERISDKYPAVVSGGEAQRASLVRALINKPAILLADEPTGSLDAKNADILGNLMVELNKEMGLTIITATHSPALADKMGRKIHLDREA